MIHIVPSIVIREGKVIRLYQGDFNRETIYTFNAVDVAKRYEDHGIKWIHMVDIDGAKLGTPVNYYTLEAIAGHTNLSIDFSGGVKNDGEVTKVFEYGAKSITAASIAVYDPELFASWIVSFGPRAFALGADALDRKIKVRGWLKDTEIDIIDHVKFFYDQGLTNVKTTDISKEGALAGPSYDLYKDLLKECPNLRIFASGGVSSVDEIKKLEDIGVHGVIIGTALHEGRIKIEELKPFLI